VRIASIRKDILDLTISYVYKLRIETGHPFGVANKPKHVRSQEWSLLASKVSNSSRTLAMGLAAGMDRGKS
jgi:hypothetical protein